MKQFTILAASVLLVAQAHAATPPKYTSAKVLTDTTGIVIDGFNNLDQVVVMRQTSDGDLDWKPTIFDWRNGGMVGDSGTPLGAMPGVAKLDASGLSDAGQVVGAAINPPTDPNSDPNDTTHPYVYFAGAFTNLSTFIAGSGANHARANRVNSRGDVVGVWMDSIGGPNHAFVYNQGTLTEISSPVTSSKVYGYDINEAGQVAGSYVELSMQGGSTQKAFLYDHGTSTKIDVGFSNTPVRINDHGQVAGYADTGQRDSRCYLFGDGQVKLLGPSSSSSLMVNCRAVGLSNDGVLAGVQSGPQSADSFPFVYGDGVLIDINSMLSADDSLARDQIKITSIEAANTKGDLVVRVAGGAYYLLTPVVAASTPTPMPAPAPTPDPAPNPNPAPPPSASASAPASGSSMPNASSDSNASVASKSMSGGGSLDVLLLALLTLAAAFHRTVRISARLRAIQSAFR